ncbi:MAG: hypothetical protein IT458_05390 [Planctomycetes bacterium]|nr:hypothetical protein [Planctomycetota bacterium]
MIPGGSRSRRILAPLLWAVASSLAGAPALAQDRIEREFAQIVGAAETRGAAGAVATARDLREFLSRHESAAPATHPVLLQARLRLAALDLQRGRADLAGKTFAQVAEAAPQALADVRGRALYGLAQARIVEGDDAAARAVLRRIAQEQAGTRYGDLARVALRQLTDGAPAPRAGQRLPELRRPLIDLQGRTHDLARTRGQPLLLVFYSPESEESLAALRRWREALDAGAQGRTTVLAIGVHADRAWVQRSAEEAAWQRPVVAATGEYLEEIVLALGVHAVPTTWVVAPDQTLMARNLPPERALALLRELSR